MGERVLREIKITWWKKPDLDGYTITVPVDADDKEISKQVNEFMESEVGDTWEWERGDFTKEYTIDLTRFGNEP